MNFKNHFRAYPSLQKARTMRLSKSNILITGKPGVGKTTLVQSLCRELQAFSPAGFYTAEIRNQGKRRGFELVGSDGRRMTLAHTDIHGESRVGKYSVDVSGLEAFLNKLNLNDPATSLVVIDEIGKMECLSRAFVKLVREMLDSPTPVIATVAEKGGGFIRDVKQRPDVQLVEVNHDNRDTLAEDLKRHLWDLLDTG